MMLYIVDDASNLNAAFTSVLITIRCHYNKLSSL